MILASVFLNLACPKSVKKSDLEKAFNYSAQISKAVSQSAIAVEDLYNGGVITFETKEKIISKIKLVRDNNGKVLEVLSALKRQFGDSVPAEELSALDVLFNQSILTPFGEILSEAGILSKEKAAKVFMAIAVLKQIIFTISNYFGSFSKDSVSYRRIEFFKENYAEV